MRFDITILSIRNIACGNLRDQIKEGMNVKICNLY